MGIVLPTKEALRHSGLPVIRPEAVTWTHEMP
jgi:hypothetical protein